MIYDYLFSRRQMLKTSAALFGPVVTRPLSLFLSSHSRVRYKIGACDWSIGKAGQVDALRIAKDIGLDGVMVSLGSVENNMHLRRKDVQLLYLNAARQYGVEISSLAIGEMNNVPYKYAAIAEEWVYDSIDVAIVLGCRVILLAFFDKGDLRGDDVGVREVIRRLKRVAPKAEKSGIILGVESWLSAEEHLRIIEAVGSPNVQVYFDVANSYQMGHDIYKEMRLLGNKYICEIHAKENGVLLGHGKIDFKKVKEILHEIDYQGWIIMEGGVPPGAGVLESYVANNKYIRTVFD